MASTLTTVGELVVTVFDEIMGIYGNEAMAALVAALVVDDLMNGVILSGPFGK